MKYVVAILLMLASSLSWGGNIVLLTSLSLKPKQKDKIEKMFTEAHIGAAEDLVIHHKVGPELLHQVLTDPFTTKVFWISHSGSERQLAAGFAATDAILDINGNDVKRFFTTTTSNLEYLGIIGCQSKPIIDGFIERNNYLDRPDLKIYSFAKKTKLFKGFDLALKASKISTLKPISTSATQPEISVAIKNKSNVVHGVSWVEMGDRVLGIFTDNQRTIKAKVSLETWSMMSSVHMKLIAEKDSISDDQPELEFKLNGHTNLWHLFVGPDGKAIGKAGKYLYVYRPLDRVESSDPNW